MTIQAELCRLPIPILILLLTLFPTQLIAEDDASRLRKMKSEKRQLENKLKLVNRAIEQVQLDVDRVAVYKAVKLTDVKVTGGPFAVGDEVTISYTFKNASKNSLPVPLGKGQTAQAGSNHLGRALVWVEHEAGEIEAFRSRRIFKKGDAYMLESQHLVTKPTVAPGANLTFTDKLSTKALPPGKYTCRIEFAKWLERPPKAEVMQSVSCQFELTESKATQRSLNR